MSLLKLIRQQLGLSSTPANNFTLDASADNGYGSTNTKIPRYSTIVTNQGSDITYTDSAASGASFTINTSGVYAISYNCAFTGASNSGVSLDSNQLTTSIASITASDRVCEFSHGGNSYQGGASMIMYLAAGSIVRPHTEGAAFSTVNAQFTIVRVS